MKITSDINKKAWTIRKQAAAKYACPVMEISWAACLKLAKQETAMRGTENQIRYANDIIQKSLATFDANELHNELIAAAEKSEKKAEAMSGEQKTRRIANAAKTRELAAAALRFESWLKNCGNAEFILNNKNWLVNDMPKYRVQNMLAGDHAEGYYRQANEIGTGTYA